MISHYPENGNSLRSFSIFSLILSTIFIESEVIMHKIVLHKNEFRHIILQIIVLFPMLSFVDNVKDIFPFLVYIPTYH